MIQFIEQQARLLPSAVPEVSFVSLMGNILATPYNKGTYDSDRTGKVLDKCFSKNHLSVLEHLNITLDCVTTIGTYKGYTRHRHCAFTIESTRFVNYKGNHTVIMHEKPNNADIEALDRLFEYYDTVKDVSKARDFLPQCTAARMLMTTNVREWRHIISIRRDPGTNPLTRDLCNKMWVALNEGYPYFFPLPSEPESPRTIYNYWDGKKGEFA